MQRKKFNIETKLESNRYYVFDKRSTDIYLSQTGFVADKKYLNITGGDINKTGLHTAFYLHGLRNVTLDFKGAKITLHGKIQPFILDGCKNVTIKNVVVEYERAMYTELNIVENTGKELVQDRGASFRAA